MSRGRALGGRKGEAPAGGGRDSNENASMRWRGICATQAGSAPRRWRSSCRTGCCSKGAISTQVGLHADEADLPAFALSPLCAAGVDWLRPAHRGSLHGGVCVVRAVVQPGRGHANRGNGARRRSPDARDELRLPQLRHPGVGQARRLSQKSAAGAAAPPQIDASDRGSLCPRSLDAANSRALALRDFFRCFSMSW